MRLRATQTLWLVLVIAWTVGVVHVGGFHHHDPADPFRARCPLNLVTVNAVDLPSPFPALPHADLPEPALPGYTVLPAEHFFDEATPLRGPPAPPA